MNRAPPDADRSDALVLTYEPTHGERRRVTFAPLSDGRWERVVERHAHGHDWRETGREPVESVGVENGGESETVEVEHDILLQAVAAMKLDARRGYSGNATTYADFRHGTARQLADVLQKDWTDISDAYDGNDVEYVTEDADGW